MLPRGFPKEELYGLTSQTRPAAVSIPSNIAEGQARLTRGEFRQSLGYAKGSLAELQTRLLIAETLGYPGISESVLNDLDEVRRLLNGLISSLSDSNDNPQLRTHNSQLSALLLRGGRLLFAGRHLPARE